MPEKPAKQPKRTFQSPKGTRDFYPEEMLRRRYIVDSWRRVALRHGFEEIDGPTFEHLDLYTVKSGEGIVSELFSFQRAGGEDTYALRPEFTPTLARMYAARARQLPQPTKWFCVSNFFRAERPQRGRLREFFQWNCDVIGGGDAGSEITSDAEIIECALALLQSLGLSAPQTSAHVNDRRSLVAAMRSTGVRDSDIAPALDLLDKYGRMDIEKWGADAAKIQLHLPKLVQILDLIGAAINEFGVRSRLADTAIDSLSKGGAESSYLIHLWQLMDRTKLRDFMFFDSMLARGLAYYTGMVFEVIAEGERAVAGGGRYDNLIELFGGPPTPACGFGMGDVVLANLLDDRGLMPSGREMLEALSRPMPLRPDVFVVAGPTEGAAEQVVPLVARLRRGEEAEGWREQGVKPWGAGRYRVPPLHARRSYKATKNIGKLLADANACHARFAVIIENPERCTLKDLDKGEQFEDVALDEVGARVAGVY